MADPGAAQIISGVITASLTAAVAAISVLSQWRAYSRALRDHSQEIDQDIKVVKFWEEWLKVRQSCTPDSDRADLEAKVRRELDSLPLFPTREMLLQRVHAPHLLSRVFLAYPPRHPAIWLARLVFYGLAIVAVYAFSMLGSYLVPRLGRIFTTQISSSAALGLILIALGFTAAAAVIRLIARLLDGPPPPPLPSAQGPAADHRAAWR